MKIVIDIPEDVYTRLFDNGIQDNEIAVDDVCEMAMAIRKGTSLPEHHGRLIDADELYGDFIDGTEGYDCNTWNRIEIGDIIEDAPTIIEEEVDKESEVEKDVKCIDLCKSCNTKGCIFQSEIVRSHCDFYKAESEE